MNAAPDAPPAFKAIIPSPTDTLCGNFLSTLIKGPALWWRFIAWMLNNDGSVTNNFKQQIIPPGVVLQSAALITDETSWLVCDGREVVKTDYPDLYTAIGDTYGAASSSSNFKIPDLRGKFMVGAGSFTSGKSVSLAQNIGDETVILTVDQMPPHKHDVNGLYAVGLDRNTNANGVTNNSGLGDAAAFTLESEIAGGIGTPPVAIGHPNIPPSIGVYYIIKV